MFCQLLLSLLRTTTWQTDYGGKRLIAENCLKMVTIHHVGEGLAAGTGSSWIPCEHSREEETRQEIGTDYESSSLIPTPIPFSS